MFLKDSIYTAIGLAAPVLYEQLDFESFLNSTLVQEVQIQKPGYNILRRRAAIILGQWLPVKEGLNRPLVYQIFQHLLDKNDHLNDQVVRVTAGRQLNNVVDPFEFSAEPFMPYAAPILHSLMTLIQELELPDTKIRLLSTVSTIVIKMERRISPFADQIISLLPPLWDQAGEECLMKQSILGLLSALVTSLQAESRKYHTIVIPLIQSSIEPTSEARAYLLEDTLDLWAAILVQTPSPNPEIYSLVQYLFPMYEVASDTLRTALEITESYIYLIPLEILANASLILSPFTKLLRSAKGEASGMMTALVELLIRAADSHGGLNLVGELTTTLLSSGLLSTLLSGLHDAFLAHQTTGPKRKTPVIDSPVETDYLNILARLAVTSPSLFGSALDAAVQDTRFQANQSLDQAIEWLLSEWFSHMDSISNPAHKKLNCLALTALLEAGRPWILSRLQSLMTLWTDVVTELVWEYDQENNDGSPDHRDCLVYRDPEAMKAGALEASADGERRWWMEIRDPVHKIDIREFAREKLGVVINGCGGMEAFQREWVQNVDQDVVKAFGRLGVV